MPAGGAHAGLSVLADLGVDAFDHVAPTAEMSDQYAVWPSDILADLAP